MTDTTHRVLTPQEAADRVAASLDRRNSSETRFKSFGVAAIAVALAFLVLLFAGILSKGIPGMHQYYVTFDVTLDAERLDPQGLMTLCASISSFTLRNWAIVVAIAAIRLSPPITNGTVDCVLAGKVPWAKFAVPVTVEMMMIGIVKRILIFLYL